MRAFAWLCIVAGVLLAVASFVNPHDISFGPTGWTQLLGFGPPDDSVPEIAEAPSQADGFAGRPPCQEQFKAVWPKMLFDTPPDLAYRRLYYFLHKVVDQAIGRMTKHSTWAADGIAELAKTAESESVKLSALRAASSGWFVTAIRISSDSGDSGSTSSIKGTAASAGRSAINSPPHTQPPSIA